VFLLSEINHPNVVRFLGACLRNGQFRLVTELLEGGMDLRLPCCVRHVSSSLLLGNLGQLLSNKAKPLSLCRRMKIARDIVKGMIYIHAANLIHLDLKVCSLLSRCSRAHAFCLQPENLLLDVNGNVKVKNHASSTLAYPPSRLPTLGSLSSASILACCSRAVLRAYVLILAPPPLF
jgi:serine/threonine protein kinase